MMPFPPNPSCRLPLAGITLCPTHTIHTWAALAWAAAPAPSPTQPSPHGPPSLATPASPPTHRWIAPNPKTTSSSPSSPASVPSGPSTLWDLFTPSCRGTVWSRGTWTERGVWVEWLNCCQWCRWWEERSSSSPAPSICPLM